MIDRASLDAVADLIQRRLVETAGFTHVAPEQRNDYQRGVKFALDMVLALLREERQP